MPEPSDRTPAQVHAAAIDRELTRVTPRWRRRNLGPAKARLRESADIYAKQVANLAERATRAQGIDGVLRRSLADAQAERDELARKLAGLDATEAQLLAENEELNRQLAERTAERDHLQRCLDATEKRIAELAGQFPACPGCGCGAPDDPDRTECGCDEGCNDGDQAPGVNVLIHQRDTAEQRLADVQAEHAKRDAAHDQTLRRYRDEIDRLRELLNEAAIADCTPATKMTQVPDGCSCRWMLRLPEGEMVRDLPDPRCMVDHGDVKEGGVLEVAAALEDAVKANARILAAAPDAKLAAARATRPRGSRAKGGAGDGTPGRSESLPGPSLGTEESGFAE